MYSSDLPPPPCCPAPAFEPFGNTADGLEGNGDSRTVLIGEFLDDVGLSESLLDIAILARGADDVSCSPAKLRRIRRHDLLESCCERKEVVFDLDRIRGIVSEVLGVCRNNRDNLPLEKEFIGQRIAFRCISGPEYISHARHLLGLGHVESLNLRAWMGTGEQPSPKHVG